MGVVVCVSPSGNIVAPNKNLFRTPAMVLSRFDPRDLRWLASCVEPNKLLLTVARAYRRSARRFVTEQSIVITY